MEKKEVRRLAVLFAALLVVGILVDFSRNGSEGENILHRQEMGEDVREENLQVSIEGIVDNIDYILKVEAMRPTKEQAEAYFDKAIEMIDESFEELAHQGSVDRLPLDKNYMEGMIKARWNIEPWDLVSTDGTIHHELIPEEGRLLNLSVELVCGAYEKRYQFAYNLRPKEKNQQEIVLEALDEWFRLEMEKEGQEILTLPSELQGVRLHWSKERSNLAGSILVLEVVAMVAIYVATREKRRREQQERALQLEADYPEIVGQLTLLLGAGMNIRQSWNIIATQYLNNRQKRFANEKLAYEQIVVMNRRVQEGENEKKAYQSMANILQHTCYHRLIRLLIGNLERGSAGMTEALEQESKAAYEQRVMLAKKAGEEASTRMLLPLMIMMVVVMVIVMSPAMIDFIG